MSMTEDHTPLYRSNIVWHHSIISRSEKEALNRHAGVVLWFTGLSGSGKSTLAHAVEARLFDMACRTMVLDGDNIRHGLCGDLGFSVVDRSENIRRISEVAKLIAQTGMIILTAFISPFRSDRARARHLVGNPDFVEIYCRCRLDVCESRDVKGLYRKARNGEILEFTGISSPYEEPIEPELVLDTDLQEIETSVSQILAYLRKRQVIRMGE